MKGVLKSCIVAVEICIGINHNPNQFGELNGLKAGKERLATADEFTPLWYRGVFQNEPL